MGFWQTGYMEFREYIPGFRESASDQTVELPPPPEFPCTECGRIFNSSDDLAVHLFDGHVTTRPLLLLRGRECGRSRLAVITKTQPEDWEFANTSGVQINGQMYSTNQAKAALANADRGAIEVTLEGEHMDQVFHFSFSVADNNDLGQVDAHLRTFIGQRMLSIASIERFLEDTSTFCGADEYRFGLANYFYGVLAREHSPESGLNDSRRSELAYVGRYQEAARSLSQFEQNGAEAVCGLVAFHFNQFDIAMRKTRSARISRISRRLEAILHGKLSDSDRKEITETLGLDHALSDMETEQIVRWCSLPLDGSDSSRVAEAEAALPSLEPIDQVKIHLIAAEHHLATGNLEAGQPHALALRHTQLAAEWFERFQLRTNEAKR